MTFAINDEREGLEQATWLAQRLRSAEIVWFFCKNLKTMSLDAATMKELKATADALSAPGKGFLASDESAGPWLRAGHVVVRHKKASFSRGGHRLGREDPFLPSLLFIS